MNSYRKPNKNPSIPEDYLYSFSSRQASPIAKNNGLFDSADILKTPSLNSVNSSLTRQSSLSATYDPIKHSDDHFPKQQDPVKLKEELPTFYSDRPCSIEPGKIALCRNEHDREIPTLNWCAFCRAETATEVFYVNSEKTFWASLGIFLSGGVFGCFLLPYGLDCCKNLKVRCHRCKHTIHDI